MVASVEGCKTSALLPSPLSQDGSWFMQGLSLTLDLLVQRVELLGTQEGQQLESAMDNSKGICS